MRKSTLAYFLSWSSYGRGTLYSSCLGFGRPKILKSSNWKKEYLTFEGRIRLINYTVVFYMFVFKMPMKVVNEIETNYEKLLLGPWWEIGPHPINWNMVSHGKQQGGFGIGKIANHNEALLGKWLWRFPFFGETRKWFLASVDGYITRRTTGSSVEQLRINISKNEWSRNVNA